MVSKSKPNVQQLSFDDYLNTLKPGQQVNLPARSESIGGELLNILSKGLYTNPLDAIREYVQNSIDANAEKVEIQVTGNSVWILDYGTGMTRDQLIKASDFGVSRKSIYDNVGFRGIGIYSGFDLCELLRVRTKVKGELSEHVLEFRFGDMRRKLEVARQNPNRPSIPLSELLEENTIYYYEKSQRGESSFTLVQLEELSDNHIHKLSNTEGMRQYILSNLPIAFNKDFKYAQEIEDELREEVSGYKSSRVILKIEGNPPVFVEKPNIPNLDRPKKGHIKDAKGKVIGYYWACLVSESEGLRQTKYNEFAGFVYKVKGFTIGDRLRLQKYFTSTSVYSWWTGEIYVTDTNVIPTSARDDFEAGKPKDNLETAVAFLLNGAKNKHSLQKIALDAQAKRRADNVFKECKEKLDNIESVINMGGYDKYTLYSDLEEVFRKMKLQKKKSSDLTLEESLDRRAKELQERVRKNIQSSTSVAESKSQSTQEAMDESANKDETEPDESNNTGEDPTNNADTNQNNSNDKSSREQPQLLPSLEILLKTIGWVVPKETEPLVSELSSALLDFLPTDLHKRLLDDIEQRLINMIQEG